MATLGWSSTLTGSYVTNIGEITSIGFSLSTDHADTTSTASKYAAYVPTTIQPNTIFVSALYDGSSGGDVQQFVREFKLKRKATWTVTFPTGTFRCDGYVSTVTVASPYDSVVRLDLVITLTGEPLFNGA